jgi:hypothetical protein
MSLLTDILVPLVGGAVIIGVIMLLLRDLLGGIVGVPIWLIACFVIGALTLFFTPTNLLVSFWRNGKEGFTFMEARKNGTMVICDVEVGTGNAEFMIGKKLDPKDPVFMDEQSGVKMDPTMVSAYADPLRFPGGLNIIGFAHDSLLPQNHRNHLAFKRIVEYIQSEPKMKPLSFMPIKEIIELLKKPEHFLEDDVKTKVGKYFKARSVGEGAEKRIAYFHEFQKDGKWYRQEILINSNDENNLGLLQLIRIAKTDLDKLPIIKSEGGTYFCMNEAFKYNPVSYTAQYASWLKNILQRMADMNAMKWFNWWTMGLIAMGIIGVSAAAIVLGFKVLGMKVGGV